MPNFGKVAAGTPLGRWPALSAGWVNGVSEMLNWYLRTQATGAGSGKSYPMESTSGLVKVKNLTASNLLRGHYVQLGDYLIDKPDPNNSLNKIDHRRFWFEGNLYDEAEFGRIAILERAAEENEIRRARIIGKCTAIIDVTDTDHRYAIPVDGEYVLESAWYGPVEILQQVASTGEQELAVLLDGGTTIRTARVTTTITAATGPTTWGSGQAQLCHATTGSPTGSSIDVDNEWPEQFADDSMVKLDMGYSPPRVLGGTCTALDASTFWGDA